MARTKVEYRMCSKTNYNQFVKENPDIDLSYQQWATIIYRFNEKFRESLYETGNMDKLPYGIGPFAVHKSKPSAPKFDENNKLIIRNPIDWKSTKEHGKYIYHLNSDTEGFKFKLKWFFTKSKSKYKDIFYFRNSRVSSRLLKQYIIDNNYKDKYLNW